MKFEREVHFQRFCLGIICGVLPVACLVFGFLGAYRGMNGPNWYYSISDTYYANSRACMIGALCLCAFFLATYRGYNLGDRLYTAAAAVAALGVVIFPCGNPRAGAFVGLLAVPRGLSGVFHGVSAATLFGCFALMTLTQFPKGRQRKKNVLYRCCGGVMLAAMAGILARYIFRLPGYAMMLCETVLLEAFAAAWIVKSGALEKRRGKYE